MQHIALVITKCGAVAVLGMLVAFLLLQLPLAAGLGAVLMALAIQSKTSKEAQAGSTLVITFVGLAPMVSLLNPSKRFWP